MTAVRPDPTTATHLEPFLAAGVFASADLHVAAAIARVIPGTDPAVVLAAALAVRATRLGHVCVVLADVPGALVLEDQPGADAGELVAGLPWPAPDVWVQALRTSAAVAVVEPDRPDERDRLATPATSGGSADAPSSRALVARTGSPAGPVVLPLVFDGARVYLERYWRYEQVVGDDLVARAVADPTAATVAAAGAPALDPATFALLDRLFPPVPPLAGAEPAGPTPSSAPTQPSAPSATSAPTPAAPAPDLVLDLGAVVQGELFPTNPAPSTDPTPATGPTPSDHPGAATDLVPSLPPAAIDTPAISPVGPPTRGSGTRAVAADRQRLAAEAALTRRLVVLAGGPGTGKTRTVARLLAAAHDAAARAGTRLDVALAAPTGKAAARMTEAVHHEVAVAGLADDLAASLLATEATTIHRLLGRTSGVEFRHDRANPLAADIVVVDEASMVSLPLMARLLDAVRPDARLVLVGDPYQLASIEAGAVLGDVAGGTAVARPRTGALVDSVIVLERVHRFGADSTIAALATAIRDGDADAALALLQAGRDDVRWIRPDDRASLAQLERTVRDASVAVVRAALDGDEQAGLAAAADLKVLAATRRGPGGTYDWRERIERAVGRAEPRAKIGWRYYTGRPVIITRNDYLNGLMNGDTGLVVQHDGEAQVVFPAGEGPRWFHPSQLSAVETWWSMTIHKSQGSEYRHAVVSLPAAPSPILTRELLYTAVTRAKQQVTLVASEEAVRAAIGRPVSRASGLLDRLWPPA